MPCSLIHRGDTYGDNYDDVRDMGGKEVDPAGSERDGSLEVSTQLGRE